MKTMTVAEYKPLFIEALRSALEERWIPRTLNPDADVPDCPFCRLATVFDFDFDNPHLPCFINTHDKVCPLYYKRSEEVDDCSDGWVAWYNAYTPKKEIAAAKLVVAELEAIDVDAWIEVLVERGVLVR